MAHDYKSRAHSKNKKPSIPGWLWLLAILLIGLFIAFLFYLQEQKETTDTYIKPTTSVKKKATENTQQKKPQFDFYEILPDGHRDIFKQDSTKTAAAISDQYLLQAGSFKTYAQADQLKAQLAFSGIISTINTATTADGKTWHRVQAGPYNNTQDLNHVRQQLQGLKIEPILLKNNTK